MSRDVAESNLPTMQMRPTEYPHIFWNEAKNLPCVAGTRLRVQDVVALHKAGEDIEEITDNFPPHTRAEICSALAYYYDHQAAMDVAQAEDDRQMRRQLAEVEARQGPSPLRRTARSRS